jgi:predicted exporter
MLAPYPILKQFAVFSMTGLLSSFLTVFCIFPYLKVPGEEKRTVVLSEKNFSLPRTARAVLSAGLAVIIIIFLAVNFRAVKIENNISSLYTMSSSLMKSEKLAAEILDYGSSPWYFIVCGSSPEEALENEERLLLRLEEEVMRGNLESFLGTADFVPSIKTQKKTFEAMKALLPLVPAQFEYLGFPPEYTQFFYSEFAAAEKYCYPKDAPSIFGISNLWIGEYDRNSYSCVLPVKAKNEEIFRSIAEEFDFVFFINKVKDISGDLDTLTKTMLLFFLAAYIVISVIICFVYRWKDSVKICAVPLLMVLTALTALAHNKIPLGFFSIAALVLVFGLGLDYIFYMTGRKNEEKKNLTLLAVILSFLTTLLSFGALAFSSFVQVHVFGITVCSGPGAAFIFAILLQESEDAPSKDSSPSKDGAPFKNGGENHRISG